MVTETLNIVPLFKPLIEESELDAATESLKLGWLGMGSYVEQFEKLVANVCNISSHKDKYVVAVSTGHAALHLSLMVIGVGPGDEVITPSFNNASDFQAIRACGAQPVFIDVQEETLCIDVQLVESLITPRTKCIIAMDYDVSICDHEALKSISKKTGIPILHDAAHSFGSVYKGEAIGNQHQYTIFSFDPVKTVTCIDGGALIVEGAALVERLQSMRLIGMTQPVSQMYNNSRAWNYDINELGFRYHLANLHAAIGISQIQKIAQIRDSRQKSCELYYNELSGLNSIWAPHGNFNEINPFLYYIRVTNGRRDDLRNFLKTRGIDTGVHWQAGHSFTFFKDCRKGDLSVTERVVEQIVSIPLHSNMNPRDQSQVIEAIKEWDVSN
jgi:dTDP-4-amino-4,6-dideoxygalactose transaminase